tara:strand:- start:342 stop:506 length:165 start_codon:yes stop_codon:yes gene_type:complete
MLKAIDTFDKLVQVKKDKKRSITMLNVADILSFFVMEKMFIYLYMFNDNIRQIY